MKVVPILVASFLFSGAALLMAATMPAMAHGERHFSAGEPGDRNKPARTVKISMRDEGKRMFYEPSRITVKKGEQIRFVFYNDGIENHEFVLATVSENRKHATNMKKNPHMEHDDPNAITLAPFNSGEILWRFTEAGTFEYACLIPGHFEAGMHGKVVVK